MVNDKTTERINLSSGTPWEASVGYSRAVRVGQHIFVSGTTASDETGATQAVDDAYGQTKFILEKINAALVQEISKLNAELNLLRETMASGINNLRTEAGIEMDRRIARVMSGGQPTSTTTSSMLNDPRNKGIEHFAGYKPEDRKSFEAWRKKAFNYLEKSSRT